MHFLQDGRELLRRLLSGGRTKALVERRDDRIKGLEKVAETAEAKNKELEEQLEFKRREHEALERVRVAKSRRQKLWELLSDYGVRRPRLLMWVMVVGGVILLFLLFRAC